MRYFVYNDSACIEVDCETYEKWCKYLADKYFLPDYSLEKDDSIFGIETMYNGALDKGEELLPFILFYFHDILVLNPDGIEKATKESRIEYFGSFNEMKNRRMALMQEIEKVTASYF